MSQAIPKIHQYDITRTSYLIQITFLLLFPIILLCGISPGNQLISLAACILFVITIPFLGRKKIDWFSIWNLLWYSVFIGVFMRSIYISYDIPSDEVIRNVFLRDETKDFLLWPMLLVLCGIIAMTIGYISGKGIPKNVPLKIFKMGIWSERRLLFSIVMLLGISWLGIYLFVTKTAGSIILEKFSAYHGVATDLSEYHSFGYLRWMASLSNVVCYISLVYLILLRKLWSKYLIFFILSAFTSITFYTFVSSRGGVMFLLINILAIKYYLNGKKLNFYRLLIFGIVALFLMISLTSLRKNVTFEESLSMKSNPISFLDPFVLTINMIDVSKTGHIVAAIPKLIDYQFGQTIAPIFVAWIPRELWSNKPVINIDNTLGMVIYGASSYGAGGVPSGLIAEMYLNFALPGVILGCFIVGYFLKIIQLVFNTNSTNPNIILLYVVCFMNLGVSFAGSSVNAVLIGTITSVVPIYIVLNFITRKRV